MAIKISGDTIVTDSKVLQNVTGFKTINSQEILGTGNIQTSGNYAMRIFTGSATWSKPDNLRAVKVTIVGGGGSSGNTTPSATPIAWPGGGGGGALIRYIDSAEIPGPVPVTVGEGGNSAAPLALNGNTSSFGDFGTATGGTTGRAGGEGGGWSYPAGTPGAVVVGIQGGDGETSMASSIQVALESFSPSTPSSPGGPVVDNVNFVTAVRGKGGDSLLGFGGKGAITQARGSPPPNAVSATAGLSGTVGELYGGGAGGQARSIPATSNSANGAQGIVIVEEFY